MRTSPQVPPRAPRPPGATGTLGGTTQMGGAATASHPSRAKGVAAVATTTTPRSAGATRTCATSPPRTSRRPRDS
eukprot:10491321-Alexandrium_andersonii.AAC.1